MKKNIYESSIYYLLEKIGTCHNSPEKPPITKINKHTACNYSLFTHCLFDTIKSKHDYYGDKDLMKNFFEDLRKNTSNIINYEKKGIVTTTKEEIKSHNK